MEALERRWNFFILFFVIFLSSGAVQGHRNTTRMSYVCPPHFIRLGHSCYFFSENKDTWQNALFACQDRDSNLSVPARWEDRNLRNYLNEPNVGKDIRWIGGIYDNVDNAWKWGGELRAMHYQSFSKMKKLSSKDLQWHCIAMMPELLYRWSPKNCFEQHNYICQTKLKKVTKAKAEVLRHRYQRMGKINEITVPSVSREVDDPRSNDVTANPFPNPKSYDLRPSPLRRPNVKAPGRTYPKSHDIRPNDLKKRSRPTAHRKLHRPYPGYKWNRHDPEASFQYNAKILKSGKTGLTPQQVKVHLARLQHLRDRQMARRKRMRNRTGGGDWLTNESRQPALAQAHARTYTVNNNISAFHPNTIVEEFDMMPPVAVVRPVRGVLYRG